MDNIGTGKLVRKLVKILKECNKNPELEKRLEKHIPKDKKWNELSVVDVHNIIDAYEKEKKEVKI